MRFLCEKYVFQNTEFCQCIKAKNRPVSLELCPGSTCVLDGMATLGPEEPQDTKIPIYGINYGGTGGRNNHDFMRFLCEKSGAKYFDMTSTAESGASIAQLKEQIGRPAMRFLGAEYDKDFVDIITPIRCDLYGVYGCFSVTSVCAASVGFSLLQVVDKENVSSSMKHFKYQCGFCVLNIVCQFVVLSPYIRQGIVWFCLVAFTKLTKRRLLRNLCFFIFPMFLNISRRPVDL